MPLVTARVCEENCPHENADHRGPTERFGVNSYADVEHLVCVDCGAWLAIGPSNDHIPRREMRLAELLADDQNWPRDFVATAMRMSVDECARMP